MENIAYTKAENEQILLMHKGTITKYVIIQLGDAIEKIFHHQKNLERKIFAVYMEMVQNILYYAADLKNQAKNLDPNPLGLVVIAETEHYISVVCGNYITPKSFEKLERKCLYINTLDEKELRKYRLQILEQPSEPESKGAGIGFVKMALVSENPLEIQAKQIDNEHYFFTLKVNINKEISSTL